MQMQIVVCTPFMIVYLLCYFVKCVCVLFFIFAVSISWKPSILVGVGSEIEGARGLRRAHKTSLVLQSLLGTKHLGFETFAPKTGLRF